MRVHCAVWGLLHHISLPPLQILTLTQIPPDVKVRFGGLIVARSVKYLGRLHHKVCAVPCHACASYETSRGGLLTLYLACAASSPTKPSETIGGWSCGKSCATMHALSPALRSWGTLLVRSLYPLRCYWSC